MNTRNFGDVIRAKLEADPELKKLVDVECRISEAVMEAYDDFKDVIHDARIATSRCVQVQSPECQIREMEATIARLEAIASLVCQDLDILREIAENRELTAENLVKQIVHTCKKKDRVIADKEYRESRFNASKLIWGLVASQSEEKP